MYEVHRPNSADEIGRTILNLVATCEAAGLAPQAILAGVSAACIFTLKRYGQLDEVPAMLRREADRLERMDALDRAAPKK
jgi:hypothetical protein